MDSSLAVADNIPTWTLGDRLRKARQTAGLDQAEMALRLGVSRKSIIRYEADETQPNKAVKMAWAWACKVPTSWIDGTEGQVTSGTAWEPWPLLNSYRLPVDLFEDAA